MSEPKRVLVADGIAEAGIHLLRERVQVDVRLGQSESQLAASIGAYDGLIVRSETKVSATVVAAARRLQVIGRAGVGIDSIDVEAATRRGIVVVNAPTGNAVAAAEHAIAMLLALARHVPAADAAVRRGEWERRRFLGIELRGKTLGLIGLGRIGSEVARRALGLAMEVVACDPFVSASVAAQFGVRLLTLDELLAVADFVSLHSPLTETTRNLVGRTQLAGMKPGACIVNCARGGLIDEEALLDALDAGNIAGAALDVFAQEPPVSPRLLGHPKLVLTPHLGGSTVEAQVSVALDVARQVLAVLDGRLAEHAVNAPMIPPETLSALVPYFDLAERLGRFHSQLAEARLGQVRIVYSGELSAATTPPLCAAVIKGLLEPISEERVNLVNAHLVARQRGLEIVEEKRTQPEGPWTSLLALEVSDGRSRSARAGTVQRGEPQIVRVDDYAVTFVARGHLLVCHNDDRPGMIGKVGTILGNADVNIAYMQVGRAGPRGKAIMVLGLDEAVPEELLRELRGIPGIFDAKVVKL